MIYLIIVLVYILGCIANWFIVKPDAKHKEQDSNAFLDILMLPFYILESEFKIIFILLSWIGLFFKVVFDLIDFTEKKYNNYKENKTNKIILELCNKAQNELFEKLKEKFYNDERYKGKFRFEKLENAIRQVNDYVIQYRDEYCFELLLKETEKMTQNKSDYMWARIARLSGINGYYDEKPKVAFIDCLLPGIWNKEHKVLEQIIKNYKNGTENN